MKNKLVELVNVSKSFGSTKVLDELCLEVKENEFLTLLGARLWKDNNASYYRWI